MARPRGVHGALLFGLVGAAYALGSQLAFTWFGADGVSASFFPAAGVTLAALVLVARREWWIVLLAAGLAEFTLDVWHDLSPAASAGYVVANLTQPLVGALLLGLAVSHLDIGRTRDLAWFIALGVIVAPAVGGVIGATTFVLDGGEGWGRFVGQWWVGDGLGVLVVGAAVLSLRSAAARRVTTRRVTEGLFLTVVGLLSAVGVLRLGWFALVYVPIALLVIIAFRVGTTGVALMGAALAFVVAESTAEGHTFWESLSVAPTTGLVYLQLGMGIVVASVLALAAEIAQRESAAAALGRSEEERRAAAERGALFDAERAARERAELLERNASRLVDANSVQEVAESAVADIALFDMQLAIFGVVEGNTVRVAAASGTGEAIVRDYGRFDLAGETVIAVTVRTGALVVASSGEEIDRRFPDAALLREQTRSESIVGAPLRAGDGRILGVLVVTSRERDWIDDHRRQLIEGVATQAGVALERALLQEQALAAAANAQFLVELGDALERETTVRGRAERLLELVVSQRRVAHAAVHIDAPPGQPVQLEAGTADVSLRTGTVPLRARGRTLGSLTVQLRSEYPERLSGFHLRDIAERAAIAIDNAALYERERDVSHSLQVGLLGEPPRKLGSALATAYLPGTALLEVGGDWYDAFELPGDRVAFVVGDVVGHGLEAAMAMGQLRGAVRALAPIGTPVDLLRNLDVFVESVPETCMATIAYAELTPSTGRLRYATAGHPPPIVSAEDGRARFLWDGRSSPLGSAVARDRVQAEGVLAPGELLLLYTDGLIERRSDGLDVMLDRLLRASARQTGERAADAVKHILAAMLGGEAQADDVCVLAFRRVVAGRFTRRLPASPPEIADLRHALAEWLEEHAVDGEMGRDLVLAVSEAAANAAEHAYGFDGLGVVDVRVDLDTEATLRVSVADQGVWRPPRAGSDRGRGTTIMRALMADVSIESGPGGTTVHMRLPTAEGVSR